MIPKTAEGFLLLVTRSSFVLSAIKQVAGRRGSRGTTRWSLTATCYTQTQTFLDPEVSNLLAMASNPVRSARKLAILREQYKAVEAHDPGSSLVATIWWVSLTSRNQIISASASSRKLPCPQVGGASLKKRGLSCVQ